MLHACLDLRICSNIIIYHFNGRSLGPFLDTSFHSRLSFSSFIHFNHAKADICEDPNELIKMMLRVKVETTNWVPNQSIPNWRMRVISHPIHPLFPSIIIFICGAEAEIGRDGNDFMFVHPFSQDAVYLQL